MSAFNTVVTRLFDLGFAPFRGLSPMWALTAVSVLTGVLMLWIFGKISNQEQIRVLRDRVRGNLMGIRLFGDDLKVLFVLQWRLLRDNFVFLRHALLPMLILMLPMLLVLVQLNLRFASRPLRPGDTALVKIKVHDFSALPADLELQAPAGVLIETPAVRIPKLGEVAWRIRAEQPGSYRLRVLAGAVPVEKEVLVGDRWGSVSTLRGQSFLDLLLYPGEPAIASASPIRSIQVTYQGLDLSVFGWTINWLVFFFVVSLAAGFAFRKVLRVEI